MINTLIAAIVILVFAIGSYLMQFLSAASASVLTAFLGTIYGVVTGFAPNISKLMQNTWQKLTAKKKKNETRGKFFERLNSQRKMNDVFIISALNYDHSIKVRTISPNSEVVASEISEGPGGSGANTAYCLGRLGKTVSVCGIIGNDENSVKIQQSFKSANVKMDFIFTTGGKSGETIILVDQIGQRSITVVPNSNIELPNMLNAENINRISRTIRDYKILHISSFTNPAQMLDPIKKILNDLPADAILSCSPGDLQSFMPSFGLGDELISRADILFFYEHQIAKLVTEDYAGPMSDIALKRIVDDFSREKHQRCNSSIFLICVKRAEHHDGSQTHRPNFNLFLFDQGEITDFKTANTPSLADITYVDGTGANDAAAAGLLNALLAGKELQAAINEASHLSMLIASEIGPRQGALKLAARSPSHQ